MQIMTHCVEEAKAQLRRQCLQRRTEMRAEAVTRVSAAIASRVAALDIWPRSGSVHSYVDSMAGEVQTEGLIRIALAQGSQVVVPVVPPGRRRWLLHALITSLEEDLTVGPFGLRQPAVQQARFDQFASLDLIIVPGLAFSSTGDRLGLGGGYYDRFLAQVAATKIGIVNEQLLIDKIPHTDHDITMDFVVTEAAVYDCRKERAGQ